MLKEEPDLCNSERWSLEERLISLGAQSNLTTHTLTHTQLTSYVNKDIPQTLTLKVII